VYRHLDCDQHPSYEPRHTTAPQDLYIRGFQSWGKSTCLPVGKSPCTFFLTSRLACMQASQTVVHPSFNLYSFFSLITPWEHCRATCQVAGKSACLYFESRYYSGSTTSTPESLRWTAPMESEFLNLYACEFALGKKSNSGFPDSSHDAVAHDLRRSYPEVNLFQDVDIFKKNSPRRSKKTMIQ
jgi:hypothetical protein